MFLGGYPQIDGDIPKIDEDIQPYFWDIPICFLEDIPICFLEE
jgi:hypothetical protein